MTDISDENTPKKLASEGGAQFEPKAPLRIAPESTKMPEYEPVPSVSDSQVNKQVQEPSEVAKAKIPTSAPISASAPISVSIPKASKVTTYSKLNTSVSKHDSSISIDDDTDTSNNIILFIVDALAAAISIAFTVLILQDSLPFLK